LSVHPLKSPQTDALNRHHPVVTSIVAENLANNHSVPAIPNTVDQTYRKSLKVIVLSRQS
jgi:hypothetical protein